MLGSSVDAAVVVIVSEVPLVCGLDLLAASPAVDLAGGDEWPVVVTELFVSGAVAALGCGSHCLAISIALEVHTSRVPMRHALRGSVRGMPS